jgi:hypothetical protein
MDKLKNTTVERISFIMIRSSICVEGHYQDSDVITSSMSTIVDRTCSIFFFGIPNNVLCTPMETGTFVCLILLPFCNKTSHSAVIANPQISGSFVVLSLMFQVDFI